jgi:enamine deaminase RidA (YjgF/YER057c/UK114 family)
VRAGAAADAAADRVLHRTRQWNPLERLCDVSRQLFATNTEWEPFVGYSRAVRVGNHIFVSGTTATDAAGAIVARGDAYAQTIQVLENLRVALERAGGSMADVVRTRMFVTDISRWQEYGRAHSEYFRDIRPVTSMIEVKALIDPFMLIEIEADALIAG